MTDNILALYFIACSEIHRYKGVGDTNGARAAFLLADDIYQQMTDEQRNEALDVRAEAYRKIAERFAVDGT